MAALNPIIIDVVFIVMLVVSLLIGFLKGFNKLFLNFFLKLMAFLLAFTPALNFVKKPLLELVNINKFYESNNAILDYIIGISHVFLVSVVLFLVLYIFLRIMVILFKKVFKFQKKKGKKLVNRIFGAVGNVLVSFVTLVMLLSALASPLTIIEGLDVKVRETKIASKLIELESQFLENETVKKVIRTERLVLILIDGNILYTASDEKMDLYKETYDNLTILLSEEQKDEYYAPLFSLESTDEEKAAIYEQFIKNIATFTDISLMIKNVYPSIVGLTDNLLDRYIGFIPAGQVITVEAELKSKVVSNLNELAGNLGIKNRIFTIIDQTISIE